MNGDNIQLLIIDPQRDFCKSNGALFVPGADDDMNRLAAMVQKHLTKLDDIHVTMDSHHWFDIAHPCAWLGKDGKHPGFFTIITLSDVDNGVWRAAHPSMQKRFRDYVAALATNNRYPLCIWPPHCLIGSPGYCVHDELYAAVTAWEDKYSNVGAIVDYVTKGSNPFTEHYSAVMADVPDPSDPSTQLNTGLIQTLQEATYILIAGEALSHCLKNTVEDIANNFGPDNVKKMVLLTDATSSVISPFVDFPAISAQFISDMKARGMQTSDTLSFF